MRTLGLIGLALVMACGDAAEEMERAQQRAHAAEQRAKVAEKLAAEAYDRVTQLNRDLETMGEKVAAAVDAVVAAQNDADRASAKAKLESLRKEKTTMEARFAEARAAAAQAQRKKGATLSQECLNNPLAKGCN